jgi:hypothetical protein
MELTRATVDEITEIIRTADVEPCGFMCYDLEGCMCAVGVIAKHHGWEPVLSPKPHENPYNIVDKAYPYGTNTGRRMADVIHNANDLLFHPEAVVLNGKPSWEEIASAVRSSLMKEVPHAEA